MSVKLGIILTCKSKCKGLFRSRKACKHHRTAQCKLANVKPRFFHFIYHVFISIAHSCEISLRQLVATFNRLNKPVWKYVKRSWALHVLFLFFILPLHVLITFHFFFVTGNFQTWRGDNYFSREQFFDTVSSLLTYFELKTKNTDTGNDTKTLIPGKPTKQERGTQTF